MPVRVNASPRGLVNVRVIIHVIPVLLDLDVEQLIIFPKTRAKLLRFRHDFRGWLAWTPARRAILCRDGGMMPLGAITAIRDFLGRLDDLLAGALEKCPVSDCLIGHDGNGASIAFKKSSVL